METRAATTSAHGLEVCAPPRLPFTIKALDSIHAPSREDFEGFRAGRRPVLITGLIDNWPAMRHWSLPYLRQRLGNREIGVYLSPDHFFPGRDQVGCDGRTSEDDGRRRHAMTASEFFDRLETEGPERGSRCYLYAFPLTSVPDLLADVRMPESAEPSAPPRLWISAKGAITPTHFDGNSNMLAQISGLKHVYVFPPSDFARLYPYPSDHHYGRHSQVFDLGSAELTRYPELAKVEALHALVGPGTVLFIPSYWWHCVYTVETSISVNVFDNTAAAKDLDAFADRLSEIAGRIFEALPTELPAEMKSYLLRMMI